MITAWTEHGAEISIEPVKDRGGQPLLRLAISNKFESGPTWSVSVEFTPDTAEELAVSIASWLLGQGWTLHSLAQTLSREVR